MNYRSNIPSLQPAIDLLTKMYGQTTLERAGEPCWHIGETDVYPHHARVGKKGTGRFASFTDGRPYEPGVGIDGAYSTTTHRSLTPCRTVNIKSKTAEKSIRAAVDRANTALVASRKHESDMDQIKDRKKLVATQLRNAMKDAWCPFPHPVVSVDQYGRIAIQLTEEQAQDLTEILRGYAQK